MQSIGFAVFGYGFMATAHIEALQALPGARVVVVCGPRLDRAQAVATEFGVPHATTSADEALAIAGVDAVVVDTPDVFHHDLVMASARAGKHVFCEKPLATSLADAREMADAVDRAGVRSMMGFSTRFSPLTRTIHDAIADGQIGRVFHVHAQSFSAGLLAAHPRWSWRTDKDRSGTGVIGDIGAHALDTCQYLLGPIVAVASSMHTCIPELVDPVTGAKHAQEVDDDTVLLVRFATGAHGSVALSRVGAVHASYPIGRRHMLFSGSGGGLLWENGVATLYPYGGEPKQLEGEPPLWGVDHHEFIVGWGPGTGPWHGVAIFDHPSNHGFPHQAGKYAGSMGTGGSGTGQITLAFYPPEGASEGAFTFGTRTYVHRGDAIDGRVDEQAASFRHPPEVVVGS
ncbi:MAG: gfo/Idh/MocA family oxidoreductase [Proteobacteria bacterium]|nr:gfo/Idh/MocA family oxidoreductase [Pseudomonadota bacterium]